MTTQKIALLPPLWIIWHWWVSDSRGSKLRQAGASWEIEDETNLLVRLLELHPVDDGPEVVAQVELALGLYAGEHNALSLSPGL